MATRSQHSGQIDFPNLLMRGSDTKSRKTVKPSIPRLRETVEANPSPVIIQTRLPIDELTRGRVASLPNIGWRHLEIYPCKETRGWIRKKRKW